MQLFWGNQKIFRKGTIISSLAQHEISVTMMKINLTERKAEELEQRVSVSESRARACGCASAKFWGKNWK